MKFGAVNFPDSVNFSLPPDHTDTLKTLVNSPGNTFNAHIGCATYAGKSLRHFYSNDIIRGLEQYGKSFDSIELNFTYYHLFGERTIKQWTNLVPPQFRFSPALPNRLTEFRKLNNVAELVRECGNVFRLFGNKLGMPYLQLPEQFSPDYFDRLQKFTELWPGDLELAIEFRHPDWINNTYIAEKTYLLLAENDISWIILDTPGRRDLLHMRLTTPDVFIRFAGSNHPSDFERLTHWVNRISIWREQGLQTLHFFIRQRNEINSPELCAHFIQILNNELGLSLKIPNVMDGNRGLSA